MFSLSFPSEVMIVQLLEAIQKIGLVSSINLKKSQFLCYNTSLPVQSCYKSHNYK